MIENSYSFKNHKTAIFRFLNTKCTKENASLKDLWNLNTQVRPLLSTPLGKGSLRRFFIILFSSFLFTALQHFGPYTSLASFRLWAFLMKVNPWKLFERITFITFLILYKGAWIMSKNQNRNIKLAKSCLNYKRNH